MKFVAVAPSCQQSRLLASRLQTRKLTGARGFTQTQTRRRGGPATFVGQRQRQRVVRTQALALPALVPVVARALTAGILFYASMNWVYYRGMRKDAEKQTKQHEQDQESRRREVDRLGPKDKRDN